MAIDVPNYIGLGPSRDGESSSTFGRYPRSEREWRDRYARLRAAYDLEPYADAELDALHLFQAEDNDGDEIARTRRLLRDFTFVIDKDAEAMFREGLTLDSAGTEAERKAMIEQGEAIMRRSSLDTMLGPMAHDICLGRVGVEIRLDDDRKGGTVAKLVMCHPESFTVVMDDATGTRVVRVIIVLKYFEQDDVDANGNLTTNSTLHVYRRDLDEENVTVTLDGKLVAEESGPHNLGVVPFVNAVFKPTREPEHGVSAAHGLDLAIAHIESLYTQAHATGNRYADPMMWGKNVDLSNAAIGRFGRSISWAQQQGVDSDVGYLEPTMQGLTSLLEIIRQLHESARATMPEFGLFMAGSNMSGEALKRMEASFIAKIEAARRNVLPAIARAIGIAVAYEAGVEFDDDEELFTVKAGPVLPADSAVELDTAIKLKDAGALLAVDLVRLAQRLGYVPDRVVPEDYAAQVMDENAARASDFLGLPRPTTNPDGSTP